MTEIAVGAMGLGKQRGAVFILYLNKDGTVKKSTQISSMQGTRSLHGVGASST